MSYYLQQDESPVNNITVVTSDSSNIACDTLTVRYQATLVGNVQISSNLVCSQTGYFNAINAQSYFVQNVIATSNLTACNISLQSQLFMPQIYQVNGSNYLQQTPVLTTIGGTPGIPWSNVLGAPSNLTDTNFLNQLGQLAGAAATLAGVGVNLASFLKQFANPYQELAMLPENLANSIEDAASDGSVLDSTNSNMNSVLIGWNNIKSRPCYGDTTQFAIPQNLVLNTTSLVVTDSEQLTNYINGTYVYKPTNPKTVFDMGAGISYLNYYSNVQRIDLSNMSLSNDGTLRRALANSNGIYIDGVSFCNQNIGSLKNVTTSNLTTQLLSTGYINSGAVTGLSNITGLINSNIIVQTLSSNLTSNLVTSNNFTFSQSGVFTAPYALNSPSNFNNYSMTTTLSNMNLYGSNISACNIQASNISAGTIISSNFTISNNIFTIPGDLNVSGVIRANYMDMCPVGWTPSSIGGLNTGKTPGLYFSGYQLYNQYGQLQNTPYNEQAAYMGTKAFDTNRPNTSVGANNPFSAF